MSEGLNHDACDRRIVELEGERDTWRIRAEEAEEVVTGLVEDRDAYANSFAAAEHTVREQREALMAVSEFGCDECGDFGDTCLDRHSTEPTKWCQTCIAIAALAPDTEGERT